MLPRSWLSRPPKSRFVIFAALVVSGCSSIGDFGRLQSPLVSDDIHAWVGQEAAAHAGAPISVNNFTDDERALRDSAFPLIEPPYDKSAGMRWFTNTARSANFGAIYGHSIPLHTMRI